MEGGGAAGGAQDDPDPDSDKNAVLKALFNGSVRAVPPCGESFFPHPTPSASITRMGCCRGLTACACVMGQDLKGAFSHDAVESARFGVLDSLSLRQEAKKIAQ